MMRSRLSSWSRDHKYAVNNGSQVGQRIKIKYRRMATNVLPFHSKEVWTERLLHQSCYFFWLLFALMLICIWKFGFFAATSDAAAADKESQPTITIFTAPKLFSNSSSDGQSGSILGVRQELAVRSWLALSPHVTVVLFGRHPSIEAFAEFVGPRVSVESNIDFTFLGTPFFHSMVARAQASSSDISVLVDPETVILPDLITTLNYANKLENDWFLVSVSTSVSQFPSQRSVNFKKLGNFLNRNRNPNTCGERLLLAWNTGQAPLYAGVFPAFLYRKGIHNRWLVNEILLSDLRLVIDASEAISSFYPEAMHDPPNHFSTGFGEKSANEDVWENNCNTHLAYFYGSLYFQQYTDSKNFARIIKCMGQNIFINKSENSANEAASKSRRMYFQSQMTKLRACVERSKCSAVNLPDVALELPAPISLPFSLTQLLEMVADENNSVVLAVAGDSYRDMLMSWVCRLRRLTVTNFLIIALDAETYQFAVLQGLPVIMDQFAPRNISFNNCHFGSECFQRVTKVKSRLVLQILKLGYNVLLSDVDVYWFHNPLPYLHSFGPAVLVAQSDEYNETGPINVPRRLNSGFYYARSDATTIAALEMVVEHASVSGLSEQPSFYDMLCGEGGTNRMGSDRCVEPKTNLTVHFLDRDLFPNGAYQGLWEKSDVRSACREKGSYILHNNWISGRQRKLERQIKSGLWAYNVSTRMCLR